MKNTWKTFLPFDPVPPLLACGNEAIVHHTRRDLLGERSGSLRCLWVLPAVDSILRKQKKNGAWKYHGGRNAVRAEAEYDQLETYRQLGYLVEKYGMQKGKSDPHLKHWLGLAISRVFRRYHAAG